MYVFSILRMNLLQLKVFIEKNCILEWDARLVFKKFENGSTDLSYNGTLIREICVLGLSFVKFKVLICPWRL